MFNFQDYMRQLLGGTLPVNVADRPTPNGFVGDYDESGYPIAPLGTPAIAPSVPTTDTPSTIPQGPSLSGFSGLLTTALPSPTFESISTGAPPAITQPQGQPVAGSPMLAQQTQFSPQQFFSALADYQANRANTSRTPTIAMDGYAADPRTGRSIANPFDNGFFKSNSERAAIETNRLGTPGSLSATPEQRSQAIQRTGAAMAPQPRGSTPIYPSIPTLPPPTPLAPGMTPSRPQGFLSDLFNGTLYAGMFPMFGRR